MFEANSTCALIATNSSRARVRPHCDALLLLDISKSPCEVKCFKWGVPCRVSPGSDGQEACHLLGVVSMRAVLSAHNDAPRLFTVVSGLLCLDGGRSQASATPSLTE